MELERDKYETEIDGKRVDLYTIRNKNGMAVKATNWGAKVQQILVPDREGRVGDVALGYDTIDALRAGQTSMGAFIGRYANRIGQAKFTLDGREYRLAANDGVNSLHGGQKGSRFVVFDARQLDQASVQMTYVFRDGEENYPGTLPLRVIYRLTDANEFAIEYDAVAADKTTVANFTTHTYFNLAGHNSGDTLGHVITINADRFTPVDATLVPTGEIRSVKGTPMDFTQPVKLGEHIGADEEQLKLAGGFDHNFVLNKKAGEFGFAARVWEPTTGREMEVWSTEPGLQLFSGNSLEGKVPRDVGKGGALYARHCGLSLEPQGFPDAPNKPQFPTRVLRAGDWYAGKTVYKFSVRSSGAGPTLPSATLPGSA
jgi:aldose 1-epimerase